MQEMLVRNARCKIKHHNLQFLSQHAREFVLQLLIADPALRPAAARSVEHPWLAAVGFPSQSSLDMEGPTRASSLEIPGMPQDTANVTVPNILGVGGSPSPFFSSVNVEAVLKLHQAIA